jgi:hypothetical protein
MCDIGDRMNNEYGEVYGMKVKASMKPQNIGENLPEFQVSKNKFYMT